MLIVSLSRALAVRHVAHYRGAIERAIAYRRAIAPAIACRVELEGLEALRGRHLLPYSRRDSDASRLRTMLCRLSALLGSVFCLLRLLHGWRWLLRAARSPQHLAGRAGSVRCWTDALADGARAMPMVAPDQRSSMVRWTAGMVYAIQNTAVNNAASILGTP